MRKSIFTFSAAIIALSGVGAAYAGSYGDRHGPDADNDGAITRAEVQAHGAAMFARLDSNGDSVIDAADRQNHAAARFARIDTDNDGELSQAELTAAREARWKHRGERRARIAERHQGKAAERFAAADTDGNGALSRDEIQAAREARQGRGTHERRRHRAMAMLRRADSNGDKAISQAEFTTALAARFAKADTDADGVVTQEERQAAREKMRTRMQELRAARQAQ